MQGSDDEGLLDSVYGVNTDDPHPAHLVGVAGQQVREASAAVATLRRARENTVAPPPGFVVKIISFVKPTNGVNIMAKREDGDGGWSHAVVHASGSGAAVSTERGGL